MMLTPACAMSVAMRWDSIAPAKVIFSVLPDCVSYSRFRRKRDAMMSALFTSTTRVAVPWQ